MVGRDTVKRKETFEDVISSIMGTADACWLWTKSFSPNGYGVMKIDGKNVKAHRLSYELFVGSIPDGLELDHLCRVRHCVNPAHLEAVTHRENVLRGNSPPSRNARKTHCLRGHEFTPENTMAIKGGRACRACDLEKVKRFQKKPGIRERLTEYSREYRKNPANKERLAAYQRLWRSRRKAENMQRENPHD